MAGAAIAVNAKRQRRQVWTAIWGCRIGIGDS